MTHQPLQFRRSPSGARSDAGVFSPSSHGRLTLRDVERFPGRTLFDRVARAVCQAGCLPRKELYESWEVARRVRRSFRGGRIVDVAGGHGLLGQLLLLLDDSSAMAIVADTALPPSRVPVHEALVEQWPRLRARVSFVAQSASDIEMLQGDLVVSSHACGQLTDVVLARAVAARARVAVLPCCHNFRASPPGMLANWVDGALAIDIRRAIWLEQQGYRIWTHTIPASITPKNRLLLGEPRQASTQTADAGE
jgi:hypothetical protein